MVFQMDGQEIESAQSLPDLENFESASQMLRQGPLPVRIAFDLVLRWTSLQGHERRALAERPGSSATAANRPAAGRRRRRRPVAGRRRRRRNRGLRRPSPCVSLLGAFCGHHRPQDLVKASFRRAETTGWDQKDCTVEGHLPSDLRAFSNGQGKCRCGK